MKLKIVSDGTLGGTQIVEAETGKMISGVQEVNWKLGLDKAFAEVTMKVIDVEVEINGNGFNVLRQNQKETQEKPSTSEETKDEKNIEEKNKES